jgi:hypothetical protein
MVSCAHLWLRRVLELMLLKQNALKLVGLRRSPVGSGGGSFIDSVVIFYLNKDLFSVG